jgi:hypothetical protein
MLDFVNPQRAGRRSRHLRGLARFDEGGCSRSTPPTVSVGEWLVRERRGRQPLNDERSYVSEVQGFPLTCPGCDTVVACHREWFRNPVVASRMNARKNLEGSHPATDRINSMFSGAPEHWDLGASPACFGRRASCWMAPVLRSH